MSACLLPEAAEPKQVSMEVKVPAVSFPDAPDAGASMLRLISVYSPRAPMLKH